MPRRCAPFATNPRNLVSLHNQAEAYGCRPNIILGLETAWGAWQLNEVALIVGRRVERNLSDGKDPFAGFVGSGPRGYRSAKNLVRKKIRINADGTW